MDIPKRKYEKRKEKARDFWIRVMTDYNAGMTPSEIAKRYRNPKTHRAYTREHIHWILNKMRKMTTRQFDAYMTKKESKIKN